MTRDLLWALMEANIAASAAVLVVLLLRARVRAWFGARAAYALWLLAPFAALATMLPGRRIPITESATLPEAPVAMPLIEEFATPLNMIAAAQPTLSAGFGRFGRRHSGVPLIKN